MHLEHWLNSHLEYPDLDLNGLSLMWLLDVENRPISFSLVEFREALKGFYRLMKA